jgi:hypothetical protein
MDGSQHKRPFWIGAALASLAPPACLLAEMLLLQSSNPSFTDAFTALVIVMLLPFPVALISMLGLGLPFVRWLRAHKRLTYLYICLGSTVIGTTVFGLLTWAMAWEYSFNPILLLRGAGYGLFAGLAFCAGSGPNNSFKPKPLRGSA